jgi:hypothetical protein
LLAHVSAASSIECVAEKKWASQQQQGVTFLLQKEPKNAFIPVACVALFTCTAFYRTSRSVSSTCASAIHRLVLNSL